jgi:hypothetical protein
MIRCSTSKNAPAVSFTSLEVANLKTTAIECKSRSDATAKPNSEKLLNRCKEINYSKSIKNPNTKTKDPDLTRTL